MFPDFVKPVFELKDRRTVSARNPASLLAVAFFLCSFCMAQNNPVFSRDTVAPVEHCFHNKNIDIFVIGTIGASHARNPRYCWLHLDSILLVNNPELLLVQVRPDHFNKHEFFDGAPEMAYLAYTAQKMKIECRGIDWWLDQQLADRDLVGSKERIFNILRNIQSALSSTRAQMIMIAVDMDFVEPLANYFLVLDSLKEWSCPRARFAITRYPDLPPETINFFTDGSVYLASLPSAGAELVQQRIKDLHDITKGKGYLFKR
jgi:hypothetical protein